jgi:PilZ domain
VPTPVLHVLFVLADFTPMHPATFKVPRLTDFRERRVVPRAELPFQVTVRGIDAIGEPLNIDTVLDNISGRGLYVRIPRRVEPGTRLTLGIQLSESLHGRPAARVAVRGVVRRVESMPDGENGLAVEFTRYRLF